IRINNAYGALLMRRGAFRKAEKYFRKALERLIERNPNPYNSEAYYLLGLNLLYQGRDEEAYDAFYKATWSNEQQEMSFYYLAAIDAKAAVAEIHTAGNAAGTGTAQRRLAKALSHIERSLVKNAHNIKARGLKAYLLRKLGRTKEAAAWIQENLAMDPFDFLSGNEQVLLAENAEAAELRITLNEKMRDFAENYLMTARDYAEFGGFE